MRYLRFKRWLTELKGTTDGLEAVYFEEVRRHAGVDAAHAYGGFLATLTAWCEHHQIPYQGVPVGTIKRHATGKGNADKAAMLAAARAKGHQPADDNEADALALLAFAVAAGADDNRPGRICNPSPGHPATADSPDGLKAQPVDTPQGARRLAPSSTGAPRLCAAHQSPALAERNT